MRFIYIALAYILIGTTAATAQELRISSTFEPSILNVGETGTYNFKVEKQEQGAGSLFTFRGFDLGEVVFPKIQGLQVVFLGPQQSVNIINSQTMVSVSYQFRVKASKAGDYTIPEFSITIGGKPHTVPEAKLKVLEGNQNSSMQVGDALALEMLLARDKVYVGESLPIQVRLYVKRGIDAQLGSNMPTKIGDAFSVSDFTMQNQRQVERNGEIYHELVWQAVVTPYKAGEYPLVFNLDIHVAKHSATQRSRLSDPFFDRFFGNARRSTEKVTLYSTPDKPLTISELPTEGRPENFTGAIGVFKTRQPDVTPGVAEVGEPMNLRFTIEGSGNFSRIEPPELIDADDWRVYSPEEEFMPTDRYDYQGRKIYDYVIIPRHQGIEHTPEIVFNFFNPDTEEYVDMTLSSRPVEIKPAPLGQAPRIPIAKKDAKPAPREGELLPIKTSSGKWVASMQPLFLSPIFLAGQTVPLIVLLALIVTRRRQNRLMNDARFAREHHARKALTKWLDAARKAANRNEYQTFYAFAQRAIQESVGRLIEQSSESLAGEEIEALLTERKVEPQTRQQVLAFLDAGEALKFGGMSQDTVDLKKEMSVLETLTTQLMKLS